VLAVDTFHQNMLPAKAGRASTRRGARGGEKGKKRLSKTSVPSHSLTVPHAKRKGGARGGEETGYCGFFDGGGVGGLEKVTRKGRDTRKSGGGRGGAETEGTWEVGGPILHTRNRETVRAFRGEEDYCVLANRRCLSGSLVLLVERKKKRGFLRRRITDQERKKNVGPGGKFRKIAISRELK